MPAVTLGPITFQYDLWLKGVDEAVNSSFSVKRNIIGGFVVTSAPVASYQMSLVADENGGAITRGELESVKSLINSESLQLLTHPMGSFTVKVVGVSWEDLGVQYNETDPGDLGFGEIFLIGA